MVGCGSGAGAETLLGQLQPEWAETPRRAGGEGPGWDPPCHGHLCARRAARRAHSEGRAALQTHLSLFYSAVLFCLFVCFLKMLKPFLNTVLIAGIFGFFFYSAVCGLVWSFCPSSTLTQSAGSDCCPHVGNTQFWGFVRAELTNPTLAAVHSCPSELWGEGQCPCLPPAPPSASANRITALICPYRTSVALCQAQGLAPLVSGWGSCPPPPCVCLCSPPRGGSPHSAYFGNMEISTLRHFWTVLHPPPHQEQLSLLPQPLSPLPSPGSTPRSPPQHSMPTPQRGHEGSGVH